MNFFFYSKKRFAYGSYLVYLEKKAFDLRRGSKPHMEGEDYKGNVSAPYFIGTKKDPLVKEILQNGIRLI